MEGVSNVDDWMANYLKMIRDIEYGRVKILLIFIFDGFP
jgi:hypothetical protein